MGGKSSWCRPQIYRGHCRRDLSTCGRCVLDGANLLEFSLVWVIPRVSMWCGRLVEVVLYAKPHHLVGDVCGPVPSSSSEMHPTFCFFGKFILLGLWGWIVSFFGQMAVLRVYEQAKLSASPVVLGLVFSFIVCVGPLSVLTDNFQVGFAVGGA